MICYKCRAELSQNDKFCSNCGAVVKHRGAGNVSLLLFNCSFYLLIFAVFFDRLSFLLSDSLLRDPSFDSGEEFLDSIAEALITSTVIIIPVMMMSLIAFILGLGCIVAFIIHFACITAKFKCKQYKKSLAVTFLVLSGVFLCLSVIGIAFGNSAIYYIICAGLSLPPIVMSIVKTAACCHKS